MLKICFLKASTFETYFPNTNVAFNKAYISHYTENYIVRCTYYIYQIENVVRVFP